MRITVRKIFDYGLWDKYCQITGTNIWAANEGLIGVNDTVELPDELVAGVLQNLVELNVHTKLGPEPTIESLKLALLLQWEFNHGTTCKQNWPHAGECAWGMPNELSHLTLEEIEAMREKLKS